jgi:hypothetical protein
MYDMIFYFISMEDYKKIKTVLHQDHSNLCNLPRDVIKLIISYCPCPQWFTLCKQVHKLASQVISPLEYRKEERGALLWAVGNNNLFAVASLLHDDRIDPSAYDNNAIGFAAYNGHKEIVTLLLQGTFEFQCRDDVLKIVLEILSQHCRRLLQVNNDRLLLESPIQSHYVT